MESTPSLRHRNYAAAIISCLAGDLDRLVIISGNLEVTAAHFLRSIRGALSLLRCSGMRPGGVVAILTEPNHPLMLSVKYAAHLLGGSTVYIRSDNARTDELMLPSGEQIRMMSEVGADFLVTDAANSGRALLLSKEVPCQVLNTTFDILIEAAPGSGPGTIGEATWPYAFRDEDRLLVTYTSGSTGRPKGVCQGHGAWRAMVAGLGAGTWRLSPPRFLAVTPLSQTVGVMVDGALAVGGSVVLHNGFSVDEVLSAFTGLRVTDCYLAVPHLYALTDDPRTRHADLSALRQVIYSGSPAAPQRTATAAEVFGGGAGAVIRID